VNGRDAGDLVLRALVKANALSLRPFSSTTKDIPLDAWGETKQAIITTPSALSLFCMKLLRGSFEKILKEKEKREEERKLRALSPLTLSPQIKAIQEEIRLIEMKIPAVEDEIRLAKVSNDKEEVRDLRRKEEQLRTEKEQLRKKEEILMMWEVAS